MAPNTTKIWILLRNAGNERVMVQWPTTAPISVMRSDAAIADGQLMVAISFDPDFDGADREAIAREIHTIMPAAEVVDVFSVCWAKEEFTCGGIPHMKPSQLTRYFERLRQPDGRLIFAISDLAKGFPGIDGAIEQGITAARQARKLLVE